jgi:hypothetical protein
MHSTSSFKPKHPQIASQNLGKPQKAAQPRKQAPSSRLLHQRKSNSTPRNSGSNAAQSVSGA